MKKGEVLNCPVYLPSLKEQQKISSLLALLDQRIETQKKIIEKYESLIRGLVEYHYWNCEEKHNIKISDIGTPFSTMNLSKDSLSNEGRECIIYGELFTLYESVIQKVVSKTNIQTKQLTLSQNNDLLFPSSTTVDALSLIAPSAICKDGVVLGGDMFGIHIDEQHSNEYLSYLINYVYKSRLARYAQGSTIIHLHYSDIRNCMLLLPPYSDQCYFVKFMKFIEDKRQQDKRILQNLESQKAYLLSQLFI